MKCYSLCQIFYLSVIKQLFHFNFGPFFLTSKELGLCLLFITSSFFFSCKQIFPFYGLMESLCRLFLTFNYFDFQLCCLVCISFLVQSHTCFILPLYQLFIIKAIKASESDIEIKKKKKEKMSLLLFVFKCSQ